MPTETDQLDIQTVKGLSHYTKKKLGQYIQHLWQLLNECTREQQQFMPSRPHMMPTESECCPPGRSAHHDPHIQKAWYWLITRLNIHRHRSTVHGTNWQRANQVSPSQLYILNAKDCKDLSKQISTNTTTSTLPYWCNALHCTATSPHSNPCWTLNSHTDAKPQNPSLIPVHHACGRYEFIMWLNSSKTIHPWSHWNPNQFRSPSPYAHHHHHHHRILLLVFFTHTLQKNSRTHHGFLLTRMTCTSPNAKLDKAGKEL